MSNRVSAFNLNINDYKSLWLHYKIQWMFRDKEITVTQEKIACQDTITQAPSARQLASRVRQLHTGHKGNLLLAMNTSQIQPV